MHRTSSRAFGARRAAAWIALASAAAATPGLAAAADMYLKLGGVKGESADKGHKGEIAIESFSWGATQTVSGHGTGGGMAAGRVSKVDSFTIKQTVRSDDVGEARVAAGDLTGDGRPDVARTHDKATPKLAEALAAAGNEGVGGAAAEASAKVSMQDISAPSMTSGKPGAARLPPELPVMAGTVESDASGLPTGKRQHGWVTVSKPLAQGSARVKVRFPWLGCAVGGRYPEASLEGAGMRYELKEVIITSCAAEQISLNYAKVEVRGWDPAKK